MVDEEKQQSPEWHFYLSPSRDNSSTDVCNVAPPPLCISFLLSGPPRAAVEKPKGPSRRSSRAEKEVEEEPVADSGVRKRSARPGTSAAVKGDSNTREMTRGDYRPEAEARP